MLNFKPFQPPPSVAFKAPREWLPRLRTLLDAHPQNDLASTEALCCRMVGDFTAGIVLHRLLYWVPRGSRSDAAIWKSDREWYAELNLSYAQMQRVRARLAPVVRSWIERAQGAPTYHYQLRVDALVRGIATVLNCSSVDVKLSLLEKVENGLSAESKNDFRQSRKSLTDQHQNTDERLKIYHPYLKRFVGFTPELSAKLADQYTRLGESNVRECLKRCDASNGKAWQYVLRALENVSTPPHAPIPLYDSPPADDLIITDEMRQAWASSDEGRDWSARLEVARNPKSTAPAIRDKWMEDWCRAYSQLEIQLDRGSFDTWLRGAKFLKYEDGIYHIGAANTYARDMLQHRLYRDIRRVLGDIAGTQVELCFEVHKSEESAVTLFKLTGDMQEAEQEFYRRWKGGNNG
ncbi:MAG TPA: hypothetical protein VF443_05040 [Nitrospira sp.]